VTPAFKPRRFRAPLHSEPNSSEEGYANRTDKVIKKSLIIVQSIE